MILKLFSEDNPGTEWGERSGNIWAREIGRRSFLKEVVAKAPLWLLAPSLLFPKKSQAPDLERGASILAVGKESPAPSRSACSFELFLRWKDPLGLSGPSGATLSASSPFLEMKFSSSWPADPARPMEVIWGAAPAQPGGFHRPGTSLTS